ncbi:hypothetical protein ABZ942_33785 [Nocardia sp. NPDC046473]|uniref:hypothetical protein n=1 Tax=Nocardia sp. NPDC046473 TaxID=3155733 RepID=UPI0033D8A53F
MSARTVTVAVGAALLIDGEAARVVEFDGRKVLVSYADGRYESFTVAEVVARARSLVPVERDDDPALVLEGLTPAEREQAAERGGHIREVLSGYRSGYAQAAAEGEPRPQYSAGESLTARCTAKAGELTATPDGGR